MPRRVVDHGDDEELPMRPPAIGMDARERQMGSLAVDLAEQQLRKGTASSQVIVHYLKLMSSSERQAQEIKELEKQLLVAKTEQFASQKRVEELYSKALNAMRAYAGEEVPEIEDAVDAEFYED